MPAILVHRLAEWIDPWDQLQIRPHVYHRRAVPPIEQYRSDHGMLDGKDRGWWRTAFYHRGRVLYFAELFAAGEDVDPIMVDNECWGRNIYPIPVLLDGYHRLAGALLAGVDKIPAIYGGRTDLRDYLTGRRREKP